MFSYLEEAMTYEIKAKDAFTRLKTNFIERDIDFWPQVWLGVSIAGDQMLEIL